MSLYDIALLGPGLGAAREALSDTIQKMISDFGFSVGQEISLIDGQEIFDRNRHNACAAIYFGGNGAVDVEAASEICRENVPIIPTISANGNFTTQIPDFLQSSNGFRLSPADPSMIALATAILECVGLLRRQRRVFVSYRRVESRNAAVQLHDLLSARGFDVFLDTHDIRPGDPFQDVLWHRLCDSDVLLMLDTPTYFESKWTRQEIGRARAKEIHVVRVVWPDHDSNKSLAGLGDTIYLAQADLLAGDGPISKSTVDRIVVSVESVRSRSIASRYMSITGRLRSEVGKIGGEIDGIGAHRAISVRLPDHHRLWAYPVVGIPTAESLNDVADKARKAEQNGTPVLVYDHVGIGDAWSAHLKWLDQNIRTVRAVKISEAAWTFAAWES